MKNRNTPNKRRKPEQQQPAWPALPPGGPASHNPAPHYLADDLDEGHSYRNMLNHVKDFAPDAFTRYYFAAAEAARRAPRPDPAVCSRDQEYELLLLRMIDLLFEIVPPGAPEPPEETPAEQDAFVRDVAACCAEFDILQETN